MEGRESSVMYTQSTLMLLVSLGGVYYGGMKTNWKHGVGVIFIIDSCFVKFYKSLLLLRNKTLKQRRLITDET